MRNPLKVGQLNRAIVWGLTTICLFVLANTASYFIRSDGYGVLGVQDGIVRVGCPFLMLERGGFVHREFVSLSAALGNLFVLNSVCGQQNNAAALDYTHRRGPPPHKILQFRAGFAAQLDRWRNAHFGHLKLYMR